MTIFENAAALKSLVRHSKISCRATPVVVTQIEKKGKLNRRVRLQFADQP